MRIIALILLMYWSVAVEMVEEKDKCSDRSDWNIKAALYMNKQLILITTDHKVFHVKNFVYETPKISFDSIKPTDLFSNWAKDIRFLFRYDNYVISLNNEKVLDISGLWGHKVYLNPEVTAAFNNDTKFMVNIYTYLPKNDSLNLMSLLAKFPEEDIQTQIKAIVSFPSNPFALSNSQPNLTNRFFVYYSEKPVRKGDTSPIVYKRHIMIESVSKFGDNYETNWKHDVKSGNCVPESVESIDTSVRLSDNYISSGGLYSFDIMEFYDSTRFRIRTVKVRVDSKSESRVLKDLVLLKDGSLKDLFTCEALAATTRSPTDYPSVNPGPEQDPDRTTKKPFKLTPIHIMIILLSVILIAGIIFLLFSIVMVWLRMRRIRDMKIPQKESQKS